MNLISLLFVSLYVACYRKSNPFRTTCVPEQVDAQTEIQARKCFEIPTVYPVQDIIFLSHTNIRHRVYPRSCTLTQHPFFPFSDLCFEVCIPKSNLCPAPPIHVARHYKTTPRSLAFCHSVSSALTYLSFPLRASLNTAT